MSAIRNVGPRPPSLDDHIVDKKYVDDRINTRYVKPSTGIPKGDLDSNVQSSLTKADNSVANTDSRLSDARTPKPHTHSVVDISDMTAAGQTVAVAADANAILTYIHGLPDDTTAPDIGAVTSYTPSLMLWRGTQAEYDALPSATKSLSTFVALITT